MNLSSVIIEKNSFFETIIYFHFLKLYNKHILKGGNNMTFGTRLRELRISSGLTQAQFADKIKLSKANVSKYESGIIEPSLDTIFLICQLFSVSADYLIGLSDIKSQLLFNNSAKETLSDQLCIDAIQCFSQLSKNGQEKALEYMQMLKEHEEINSK